MSVPNIPVNLDSWRVLGQRGGDGGAAALFLSPLLPSRAALGRLAGGAEGLVCPGVSEGGVVLGLGSRMEDLFLGQVWH